MLWNTIKYVGFRVLDVTLKKISYKLSVHGVGIFDELGIMEVNSSGDTIKHQKIGEQRFVSENRIELEDLPEPILLHILWFLPTKDVLRASVLSKRWKDLWKSVNSFRFKESVFCKRSQRKHFSDTVDRVLLLRDSSNIHLFSLSCGVGGIDDNTEDGDDESYGDGDGGTDFDFGDDDDDDDDEGNDHENGIGDGDNDGERDDTTNNNDENDGEDDDNGEDDGVGAYKSDATRVNNWISIALNHKVQVLRLRIYADISFPFHPFLFTCESLTDLKLDTFLFLILPSRICFPRLKILNIKHATFLDEQSTNQLFSGCPVLEKLVLDECIWDHVKSACISIPTLQALSIFESEDQEPNSCQVMIFGERLKTFDYVGELQNDYSLCGLSSLVDSSISMGKIICLENEGRQAEIAYRAHKVLKGLSNVRDLFLCCDMVNVLGCKEEFFTHMPLFPNLAFLQVNLGVVNFACGALQKLLQNCSSLTTLLFPRGITLYTPGDACAWKLDPVPSCFLTQLKTVQIGDFNGTEPEKIVTSLFIENARVLERFCIKLGGLGNEEEGCSHQMIIPIRSNCEMCVHI